MVYVLYYFFSFHILLWGENMFTIVIGLFLVMMSNIVLGASIASIQCTFCKKTLTIGIIKVLCIVLGGLLMYICVLLNPEILVANIQGIDVNLTNAMELLFTSGIIYYAGKDLKKLKELLQIDSSKQEGGE